MLPLEIRPEKNADRGAVRAIHDAAFGQPLEGALVDALRASEGVVSLVAERDGGVVGHILFTPVLLEPRVRGKQGLGLGPMAVLPDLQRQGIGSALVRQGLARVHRSGCPFVVVLGHPDYYPRFGFVPASDLHISSQWHDVPDEAFMIVVFDRSALPPEGAIARYRPEFDWTL